MITTNTIEVPSEVKQLKQWLAQEKRALAAAGVTSIVGEYSGSGDEGNFNGVCVVGPNGFPSKYKLPPNIYELIEKVTDLMAMPGYEINDGGGGSITLNVEKGTIVHESYALIVERYVRPEVCY